MPAMEAPRSEEEEDQMIPMKDPVVATSALPVRRNVSQPRGSPRATASLMTCAPSAPTGTSIDLVSGTTLRREGASAPVQTISCLLCVTWVRR